MGEILDDELTNSNSILGLTSNIKVKSIGYAFIMLIGSMLYVVYAVHSHFETTVIIVIYGSSLMIITFMLISGFLTVIKSVIRKRIDTKTGINKMYDPLWFQILRNAFILWSICMFLIIVGKIV